MSIEITLIILLAAAFHAGWNKLIKISGDRVAFVTLAGSLISILFLPFVDAPDSES